MSKALISEVLRKSLALTDVAARRATDDLLIAIVIELRTFGKFTLPGFGTFTVRTTKARRALHPQTGASMRVRAGKTVRFRASPVLKKRV